MTATTPDYDGEVHLIIRCPQCSNRHGREPVAEWPRCPKFMVSGLIIAFHSNHEGHQLEVEVDGELYVAPK